MPKALASGPDGVPWLRARASALAEGGCDPVLVVLGASATDAAALLPEYATAVVAADWEHGMGASLRAGLRAAAHVQPVPDAVLVVLVDLPGVTAGAVARLAALAAPSALAQATYGGVPGHPVLLGREHWPGAAAAARGDQGARAYLNGRDLALVECGDVGDGMDVDVPGVAR